LAFHLAPLNDLPITQEIELLAITCTLNHFDAVDRLFPTPTLDILQLCITDAAFTGKHKQTLSVRRPAGSHIKHVLYNGLGETNALNAYSCKQQINALMPDIKAARATHIHWILPDELVENVCLRQIFVQQVMSELYHFNRYQSDPSPAYAPDITFYVASDLYGIDWLKPLEHILAGLNLSRDLSNRAPNDCTPETFWENAKQLAAQYPSIRAEALFEDDIKTLGMGAYYAVGQGSTAQSVMSLVHYRGAAKADAPPIVLVGKGVTFDTGGISLKGADGMENMRYDMCGAAVVLGVMQALAALELPINVIGVAAGVENMPDGKAYRPGDILTSLSGQTIEVMSTDAEGRLVLCDALTYMGRYNPKYVIDIATLTGAAITSLGSVASLLVANDQALANQLITAGTQTDDKVWQMPLWPEYHSAIDSPFADMQNSGQNSPGAITAGCFLAKFTREYRWAHLDIAGSAFTYGKGNSATGRPVQMLIRFLQNLTNTSK